MVVVLFADTKSENQATEHIIVLYEQRQWENQYLCGPRSRKDLKREDRITVKDKNKRECEHQCDINKVERFEERKS